MSQSRSANTPTLRVSRTFSASRERVFAAWTDPQQLKTWWGPHGFTTPSAEIDLRVGGGFRLAMRSPDGKSILLTGTYREVSPPTRLVYTWQFEGSEITLVTVEFNDRGNATEVVLTHEKFASEEARASHQQGWGGCLDRLADFVRA